MPEPSRIVHLATQVAANTAKVDAYLTANSLPSPSFAADYATAASESPIPSSAPAEIKAAHQAVLRDALELHQLMLGPREHLNNISTPNYLLTQLAIVRLNLANAIPLTGNSQVTFSHLAASTSPSIPEKQIRKIIRHAVAQRVFTEPYPGVVSHSAASALLATDPDLAGWIHWLVSDCWPAAYRALDAMARWPDSEEPHHTGFALAHYHDGNFTNPDNNISLFDFLPRDPARASRFAAGMRLYAKRPGVQVRYSVEGWLDGWKWLLTSSSSSGKERAKVVDIGGSHGQFAQLLAQTCPNLIQQIIVQDIDAATISRASSSLPESLAKQVTYMTHDFFKPQPVPHARVYFFRYCFHNWSDKYAVQMLNALKGAMKKGYSYVVINDVVIPSKEELDDLERDGRPVDLVGLRTSDLAMAYLFNASDRERSDWERLFELAGPGFRVERCDMVGGAGMGIVVALWVGEEGDS
ncbi:S-adenosyl-L-methionine-dependent methyltransferase [Rhypophila decipiens]|uniref:S-adenosyl-L-methionine-dependent methyltransferase n=1 Tax=Rhypophila decipiens TaxID=261697 RepID=A0AAN6YBU8_9PEZI|nr:S-adenosyl-L-methionine-dependent methyltransferase [Rhypophila decipiens]